MLDDMAEDIVMEAPPTLQPALSGLTMYPYLRQDNANPAACVDIFSAVF